MPYSVSTRKRTSRKLNPRKNPSLQKPNGVISPRVQKVGGEKFAIVCIDPAKHRSEWMMADYYGNVLIQPQTLEHQGPFFQAAVARIQQAQAEHDIQDTIVVVERTGNYHLPPKRAFARAGFETRVVHPFATKQYRVPANPGNKTDKTDLHAQHRAAVAGFGLCEYELESPYRELQLRERHRRNLVEKGAGIACQIRDHLHLAMPGFASLFDRLVERQAPLAIASRCDSPAKLLQLGQAGLSKHLRKKNIRHQVRTIDKVLAWAAQAANDPIQDGPLHHAIWTDLYELYQHYHRQIAVLERELAHDLVQTPYIRLLAIPGINVVSAAELAGEMGPMTRYANANAITGRAGLYPSRHQSDQTDHDSGPIIRQANRRLRCVLMRIADNLACHCAYYRGQADMDQTRGVDTRACRVKIAKRFSRLALACVAGDQPMRHPCFRKPDSILEKLREFHYLHQTSLDRVLVDLQTTVEQLPYNTCGHEQQLVAKVLEENTARRKGGVAIGELLPAVLARLELRTTKEHKNGDRS
ncbi:IS110 family transposase [Bythopirellula goksoeyrii]|uniref:Transposase IS116/IS110/IS902 family protein n=1 Tax=Bythopirellula goksoeyrii TaxID=1400387 RepID=A0A5B9QC47_9BACT|nr:transposase [Bythopirellula goksoeyrii]QEG35359.1 Transposase IS116/IS110/IS902 family protein [Bythopirellula goksoeyrii]